MTVFLDDYRAPHVDADDVTHYWSWLTTDDPTLNELHQFARQLNIPAAWFTEHGLTTGTYGPHYAVTDDYRAPALAAGAEPISCLETAAVFARAHSTARQQRIQYGPRS